MSDTPETDAAAFDAFDGQGGDEVVFANLARRFERERNKAEAGWLECRNFAQRIVDERNRYKSEVEVITRERDEARNIARWLDDYEAMEALLCEMQGLRDELVDVKRERDEQTAQMCQAIGYLSTIAEDCEAWLNGESDEPSMEFIKAVRDYARKAINA